MTRDASLLLIMAARHYGYQHAPLAMQGDLFAIAGSVALLLALLWLRPWWPIAAWAGGEELLVAGCSVWWLIEPWSMDGQTEQCSARIGFKLGSIGLVCLAFVTFRYHLSGLTGRQPEQGGR